MTDSRWAITRPRYEGHGRAPQPHDPSVSTSRLSPRGQHSLGRSRRVGFAGRRWWLINRPTRSFEQRLAGRHARTRGREDEMRATVPCEQQTQLETERSFSSTEREDSRFERASDCHLRRRTASSTPPERATSTSTSILAASTSAECDSGGGSEAKQGQPDAACGGLIHRAPRRRRLWLTWTK